MHASSLRILKSLAHPTRLEIVGSALGKEEVTCQELSRKFDLAQPTMSHHFNKLVDAGVLTNRRQGTLWHYSLNEQYLNSLGINIGQLLTTKE